MARTLKELITELHLENKSITNREEAMILVTQGAGSYLRRCIHKLRCDKELAMAAFKNGYVCETFPSSLTFDIEFMIEVVKLNPDYYRLVAVPLRKGMSVEEFINQKVSN